MRDDQKTKAELLGEKHLKVRAQAVGGTVRRNVSLDVEHGIVYYTEGDGSEKQLWRASKISGQDCFCPYNL
jgi:hypothetical protein